MAGSKFATEQVAETAKHPAIVAALAVRNSGIAASIAHNVDAFAAGLAPDLVVNAPGNRIARRDGVIQFFKADQIRYRSVDSMIEFVEARGDSVVLMGEETVTPISTTRDAGKTVRRRFTDVYRKAEDGRWYLTIRQATNISVE
jgi:ketosteroid isomerase-like protein